MTSLHQAARVALEEASAITGWLVPAVLEKALRDFDGVAAPAVNSVAVDQAQRGGEVSTVVQMQRGILVDTLSQIRQYGFDLGYTAISKNVKLDSSKCRVMEVRSRTVVIQSQDELLCELTPQELVSSFDVVSTDAKKVEVAHPKWPLSYMRHPHYLIHVVQMRIMMALHNAAATVDTGFDRVSVLEKPKRMVRSSCAIARGGLSLVPNATKVLSELSSDPVAEGEVSVVYDTCNNFAGLCGG